MTLELDGVIIGAMYLFRWRDELMSFQNGFDPDHGASSPAHVPFGRTCGEAIRRGLRRADRPEGECRCKGARRAAVAAATFAIALVGCGGSDGGSADIDVAGPGGSDPAGTPPPGIGELPEPASPVDSVPVDAAQGELPDAIRDSADTSGLRLVVDGACGGAGDEIRASLFLNEAASGEGDGADGGTGDAGEGAGEGAGAGTNVTAFASFDQGLGNSIELVSRTDDALTFRFVEPDVVALTATLERRTLTRYFGAWPAGAPEASALRKVAPAGCLWSLRLPPLDGSPSFCGSVYSRGAGAGLLGQDVRRLDVSGCESVNEAGLQIIELDPVGG